MTVTQKFHNLHGSEVSREDLQDLILEAKESNETEIVYRLSKILLDNPNTDYFDLELKKYPTSLNAPRHKGAYKQALTECGRLKKGWKFEKGNVVKVVKNTRTKTTKKVVKKNNLQLFTQEEMDGLGVPYIANPTDLITEPKGLAGRVTADDIYKMITDKMMALIDEASGYGYKKTWHADGYLFAKNFVSKKAYRGINHNLLTGFGTTIFKNPFFLTFKQIEKLGGKIKKGSKGFPVVYYTRLFSFEDKEQKLKIGTYDGRRFVSFAKKNKNKIPFLRNGGSLDQFVNKSSYMMLKYYNVFNGEQVDGIDFKLDEYKKENQKTTAEKIEIAESIVKNYPPKVPKLKHGGDKAFYSPFDDDVTMPRLEDFESNTDYYRTLFHEFIHSTGHYSRLDRLTMVFSKKDPDYAKEELVAEFGAVFLSAHAGIIWRKNENHAEYLKNWLRALKIFKDDKKLLLKASADAQKATDYILNLNDKGEPAFYKDLKKKIKPKKTVKPTQIKLALNGISLDSSKFAKMRVSELRKYTLNYYKEYLKGNQATIGNYVKKFSFTGKGARKIMQPIYKEKVAVLERLEDVIKNSTYNNWGDRKKTDDKSVIGYLNFKSKVVIDGIDRHVVISLVVDTSRDKKFKSYSVGKKESVTPRATVVNPKDGGVNPLSNNKDTKKNKPTKKGLGSPTVTVNSLASKLQNRSTKIVNYYDIDNKYIADFLGKVEQKEKESVVITVTGGQGSMKTRFAFRFMNALAQKYKVGHASIEEHPESSLYWNKVHEYISENALYNIENPEITNVSELDILIKNNDVIVIDSFAKMQELERGFEVDKDLRKKYNGKLFLVIFQQTSDGRMRGGTKSQYDADIVLFTEKFDNYEENYVYADKNRYQNKTLSDLKYNIFKGKLDDIQPIEKE